MKVLNQSDYFAKIIRISQTKCPSWCFLLFFLKGKTYKSSMFSLIQTNEEIVSHMYFDLGNLLSCWAHSGLYQPQDC